MLTLKSFENITSFLFLTETKINDIYHFLLGNDFFLIYNLTNMSTSIWIFYFNYA